MIQGASFCCLIVYGNILAIQMNPSIFYKYTKNQLNAKYRYDIISSVIDKLIKGCIQFYSHFNCTSRVLICQCPFLSQKYGKGVC